MKASRLAQVAAQSILKNKMRTLLTMLGIIIGVGAVIVLVSIGAGAQARIEEQVKNLGTNMIVVTPGSTSQSGASQGAQSFNRLTIDDADALREGSLLLTAVSPVVLAPVQIVGGAGNWRAPVMGVSTDYAIIRNWQTEAGRFFDESDERVMRKVAVLGRTVADNLFPDGDAVGQQVRLRDVPFEIVGVLAGKGQTAEGNDQDDIVLAPQTTVRTRLSGRSFIGQIIASTSTPDDLPAAQAEIALILRGTHRIAEGESDDFTVRNQTDITETAQATTEVMTLLLSAIASISLLVGGTGIMNIMLVSVTERTREIGVRMALGARASDVLTQFLVESVVMSVVGGVIGVGAGFGGAMLLGRIAGWSVAISADTVVVALVFSAGVGTFFGFYPARKAARLKPIEALRYE